MVVMVLAGVRPIVLLVRLVGLTYSRQLAAVDVHGVFVQIQFD